MAEKLAMIPQWSGNCDVKKLQKSSTCLFSFLTVFLNYIFNIWDNDLRWVCRMKEWRSALKSGILQRQKTLRSESDSCALLHWALLNRWQNLTNKFWKYSGRLDFVSFWFKSLLKRFSLSLKILHWKGKIVHEVSWLIAEQQQWEMPYVISNLDYCDLNKKRLIMTNHVACNCRLCHCKVTSQQYFLMQPFFNNQIPPCLSLI